MEIDWEVEIGPDAPVIDALWPGLIDLRTHPERIGEIQETAGLSALLHLLLRFNGAGSSVWTSKCDVWMPAKDEFCEPGLHSLACYIDLLPRAGLVFADWQEAEALCRIWVQRLSAELTAHVQVDLVIRRAVAAEKEGFGITAYLAGRDDSAALAASALHSGLVAFADAVLAPNPA